MTAREAIRPITELAAVEGVELHRSELQHLKVKLETWKHHNNNLLAVWEESLSTVGRAC